MSDFYDPLSPAAGIPVRDRRPEVCEILPGLFVGEYPRPEDIAWLHNEFGVGAVVSLQDDDDLTLHQLSLPVLDAAYAQHRIAFCRVPVADFNCQSLAASLSQALDALHGFIQAGQSVFVHCNAGCNRAPTLAIAYLHAHRGLGLEEARDFVKARRACGPYMQVLYEYFSQP